MALAKRASVPSPQEDMLKSLLSSSTSSKVRALKQVKTMGEYSAMEMDLGSKVISLMEDPSASVQEHALYALGAMGSAGAKHVDSIAKKLAGPQKQVKIAAIQAIGSLGECAAGRAVEIEAFLEDADLDLVAAACTSLGGLQATSSAAKIAAKLSSGDADLVEAASGALASMDSELDAVAKLLSSKDARIRAAGVGALISMSKTDKFAESVAPLLGDADCMVRTAAASLFCTWGNKASGQVSAIGKFLADEQCGAVAAAATALSGIGSAAASQVAALEGLLEDTREDTSSRMLCAAGIAPKAPAGLRKPACAAASALAAMGSAGTKSAAKIAECLASSKDWEARAAFLGALGGMGKDGSQFESKVLEKLGDPVPAVVAAACVALGQFAKSNAPSSTTAEAVADVLASPSPQVRAAACQGLGMMGEEAEAFLETFVKMFGDGAACVQVEAMKAVVACGDAGQMYAAEICRMMFEGDVSVRVAAIESMALMGERGRCFSEELESLWEDPEVGEVAWATCERMKSLALPLAEEEEGEPVSLGYDAEPSGPLLPVGLLFPGQGSQYVKMLADVKDLPMVKAMMKRAKTILGYDLLQVCLSGPELKLEKTRICQPAMYVGGLAGMELLKQDKPELATRKQAVAGLSLGEYTALTVAGVFDFETGLRLVKLRGEAMQEAAEASPQSMVSIAGLSRDTLVKLCEESKTGPTDICNVANFLFPQGFACAGSKAAVAALQEKALKEPGCLQAKTLKTSGAFHTDFMKPAKQKLMKALLEAEPQMKPPKCEVYMNVIGKKIAPGTPPSEIVDMLASQLTSCVEWSASMTAMIEDGIEEYYECGPMKQLKAMMKRINTKVWEKMTSVYV